MIQTLLSGDNKSHLKHLAAYHKEVSRQGIDRYRANLKILTPAGETKWFSDCSLYLHDERTGEVTGSIGILQDITELKKTEQDLQGQIIERKNLEKEILHISEREKRLIGQELHDSVGQQFAGIAFMVKVLEQQLAEKMPEQAANAAEISELVGMAMDQSRRLAKGLHPVGLDANNLFHVLSELTETTRRLFGIECTFTSDNCIVTDSTVVAGHIYRIAQEAITNAIKHAHAKKIEVSLKSNNDSSVLTVKNDGRDFQKGQSSSDGMGLKIMEHRAEMIAGNLNIESSPHGGTILTCTCPFTSCP